MQNWSHVSGVAAESRTVQSKAAACASLESVAVETQVIRIWSTQGLCHTT